ncbi:hypothetical protein GGR56DRAFT_683984 [Xylariaceae sp. FL0804]|nr:hypothetical protein GGR56DRAFT_683984 [Xylariaceae sp. FL0804]
MTGEALVNGSASAIALDAHIVAGAEGDKVNGVQDHHLAEPSDPALRFRTLDLVDRYIDEPRALNVAIIGAGIAGLIAGVLLPAKVPGIKLTIYEKNEDVGGTWFENVYPGVRCDIPAHVYQTSFEPNSQWSEEFAQGKEIREYWQHIARKYGVYDFLEFSSKVEGLQWNAAEGAWEIEVTDMKTEERSIRSHDFVLTAIGRFNAWKLPDYPGINEFQGVLRHASHWDPSFDPTGKRIAVIGNGASGIQLVSNLQERVSRLDHYARNRTWIASSFGGDDTSIKPKVIPVELREGFKNPDVYSTWRKGFEDKYWRNFNTWLKNSDANQRDRQKIINYMQQRLTKKPELLDSLVPDFSPHCRRLTPGPGYLEAITSDKVDYVQTPIKRFTATGIETTDGTHREVDAIFCATGANVDMVQPFPIQAHGVALSSLWKRGGDPGFPYTYLGAMTPGFPNLLFLHGPNAAGRSGSVPHSIESQTTFFAKILRKAAREGVRAMAPSRRATDDFVEYLDAFFRNTVLSENCSSWYNSGIPGSRIHGLWPGSGAHAGLVQKEPRWEDWEYEYLGDSGNRFLWYFGNGGTAKEADPTSDMTPYIQDPAKIDLRDVHESWWSFP